MRLKVRIAQILFCTAITATHQSPLMESHAMTQSNSMQFIQEVIFSVLRL